MNPRNYEWLGSILVEGGSTMDVIFLILFSMFFDISKQFCRHNESIEWYFLSWMCLYGGFESLYG